MDEIPSENNTSTTRQTSVLIDQPLHKESKISNQIYLLIGLVGVSMLVVIMLFMVRPVNHAKVVSMVAPNITPIPTLAYGVVIHNQDGTFAIDNGKASPVTDGQVNIVKTFPQNYRFYLQKQDNQVVVKNALTLGIKPIGYSLKTNGHLHETLGSVVYSINRQKALFEIVTYDETKQSSFGGITPLITKEYIYDYILNNFSSSNVLKISRQVSPDTAFWSWDSDSGLLYGDSSRIGEGGDGTLLGYYVVDVINKKILHHLSSVMDQKQFDLTMFDLQKKFVTIRKNESTNSRWLVLYDMDHPETAIREYALPDVGSSLVSPIEFTPDGQNILLVFQKVAPYINDYLLLNLSTGQISNIYTDATVLRSDSMTFAGVSPTLSPDGSALVFTDYTNFHQKPYGPEMQTMKVEDNRYNIVFVDLATKSSHIIYSGTKPFSFLGFIKS